MGTVQEIMLTCATLARGVLGVSFLILVLRYRRLSTPLQVLGWFLAVDLATELWALWLYRQKINNLPLLHLYTLLEFVALSLFYRSIHAAKPLIQRWFMPFVVVVAALIVANSWWLQPLTGFNSYAKALVQIIFIAYAVHYFFDAYGKTDFALPENLSIGLINIGILIYNGGSLFIFMFANLLHNAKISPQTQTGFWVINALLFLILQILIFISLWRAAFRTVN